MMGMRATFGFIGYLLLCHYHGASASPPAAQIAAVIFGSGFVADAARVALFKDPDDKE